MQLNLVKFALTNNAVLLGYFNLDFAKKIDFNYAHKMLFEDFEEILSGNQHIPTWSRMVNVEQKTSIIDHFDVKDPTIANLNDYFKPCFGDHELIRFKKMPQEEFKRDWRHYSKENLLIELNNYDWSMDYDNVQDCWNQFENQILFIIDTIGPYVKFHDNVIKTGTPPVLKNKIYTKNRLLKNFKQNPSLAI